MKDRDDDIRRGDIASLFLSGLIFIQEPEKMVDFALDFFLRMDIPYFSETGSIFLFDVENRVLSVAAHRGGGPGLMSCQGRIRPGECLCGAAAESQRVLFSQNTGGGEPRHAYGASGHGDLCVPLRTRAEKLVGVWHADIAPGAALSQPVIDFLSELGVFLGTALDRALTQKATASWNEDLRAALKDCDEKTALLRLALAQARDAKTDFLVSMNHELRTPLNPIIGFSQVLLGEYFGPLNVKQKEHVNDILESGKRLLSLIDEILDLSRADMGMDTLEPGTVSVAGLVSSMFLMVREKAFKHGITLATDIPDALRTLEISADEKKLKTALLNILQNAVKFTPDGGRVTLGARLSDGLAKRNGAPASPAAHEGWLEIFVEDSGQGVDREDQERIFEDFYQVRRGLSGKTPGAGLGLALARRFVQMHGGRLWVESEGMGKGSRFIMALPLGDS